MYHLRLSVLIAMNVILLGISGGIWLARHVFRKPAVPDLLVKVDTAIVRYLKIYPSPERQKEGADDSLILRWSEENRRWEILVHPPALWKPAADRFVRSVLQQLSELRPLFLAGNQPEHWKAYQVTDSQGIRVLLQDAEQKALADIRIGKMGFVPGRGMVTYIRLSGDERVFAIGKFIEIGLSPTIQDWRDMTLTQNSWMQWTRLEISCLQQAFSFQKDTATRRWIWQEQGKPVDSVLMAQFLPKLTFLRGDAFADTLRLDALSSPVLIIRIYAPGKEPAELLLYEVHGKTIARSSLQPEDVLLEIQPAHRIHQPVESFLQQLTGNPNLQCRLAPSPAG